MNLTYFIAIWTSN